MKIVHHRIVPCAAVAVLLLGIGCYDRHTGNYSHFPELTVSTGAIVDETELNAEERARRLETLKKLDAEPDNAYTINAGDGLAVTVYNHPDLAVKTTVTPDGYIGIVFIGQIRIAGLTLAEGAALLETELARYIKNPKVGISPYEILSETATIAGAVNHPGMYTISHGMRLADLFAKAGGAAARYYDGQTLNAADLNNSIFVRNGDILPVDFTKALEEGDRWHNIRLRKGDYVHIAVRDNRVVCLFGDVRTPRRLIWDANLGVLELLTISGGLSETYWKHAIIIRGGVTDPRMYKVDLDGILQGRKPNVPLEAGDIVYVPKDDISEYNVFVRKLLPTGQLLNMLTTPMTWYSHF